ncbi:MAG: choice-of-anchor P family protein [Acidimicrobiales bacterium]
MKARLLVAAGLVCGSTLAGPMQSATADAQLLGYQIVAQANVLQITEDYPTAPARPIIESEVGYSEANIDGSGSHALAASYWPGALAGNAGTLLGVLGYPTITQLNYPIRAEAPTATGPTSTLGAGTAQMSASTQPTGDAQKNATSQSTLGTVQTGVLTLGSTSSQSTTRLAAGKLTADASSVVANVDIGGVVTVGSVNAHAFGVSIDGGKAKFSGSTTFQDLKIAGQKAYVDGTGIHLGSVGNPSGGQALSAVNQALGGAGMTIYFSSAQKVSVAGFSYYYPASILVYWHPPGNSHDDTFTVTLGGAAVSMTVTSAASTTGNGAASTAPSSSEATSVPPNPTAPTLAFPTNAPSSAPTNLAVGPAPTPPASAPFTGPTTTQLAVATPHGLGVGWLLLLGLLAIIGAVALPRVPALLRAAAPACDGEAPWPTSDPDRRS